MANSRTDMFNNYLKIIEKNISELTHKKINAILTAITKPEYLNQNSQFIVEHTKNLKNTELKEALLNLYTFFQAEFPATITEFPSDNPYYTRVMKLSERVRKYVVPEKIPILIAHYQQVSADAKKLKQKFGDKSPQGNLSDHQLVAYHEDSLALVNRLPTRFQIPKEEFLATKEYGEKITQKILHIAEQQLHAINILCDNSLTRLQLEGKSFFSPDTLAQFKKFHAMLEATKQVLLDRELFEASKSFYSIVSERLAVLEGLDNTIHEADKLVRSIHNSIRVTKSPQSRNVDVMLSNNVLKADVWMTHLYKVNQTSVPKEALSNVSFCIAESMYEHCVDLLMASGQTRSAHTEDAIIKKLYATVEVIKIMVPTFFSSDANYVREFNYLYFAMHFIKTLKALLVPDMKIPNEYHQELATLMESAFYQLYTLGHASSSSPTRTAFGTPAISAAKLNYYRTVCQVEYLALAGECLVILHHFKRTEFVLDKTDLMLKKYMSAEDYARYQQADEMEGVFDTILKRIHTLDVDIKNMRATLEPHYHPPAMPSPAESDVANQHYHEIMIACEKEAHHIQQITQATKQQKKITEKKKLKARKTTLGFFQQTPTTSSTQSSTQQNYYLALRLRSLNENGHGLESAMSIYHTAVACYLAEPASEKEQDYFYIAACLAELADCHMRQDSQASCAADADLIMIQNYKQAMVYAKAARDCFFQHVTLVKHPTTPIKHFEDLSQHIHSMLKAATDKLHLAQHQAEEMAKNSLAAKQQLKATRLAAIERAGGFSAWKNNPNPKNIYREIQDSQQLAIEKFEQVKTSIEECLQTDVLPVQNDFAYLAGKDKLPLLHHTPATSQQAETIAHEKLMFVDRIILLSQCTNLLKSGKTQQQALEYLTTQRPRIALIEQPAATIMESSNEVSINSLQKR